ncbi:helix-turn-helix domain-containing protein [Streptomyces rubellomurinus]|uniref:MerR family transcriptional regulator n=2 Tax=Streptomyces TaxID=1883 RepID=A0A0F2THH6_STRR3|nr:helix-turn-helix domain-containing protein [Streptomyces rubellomurinus]KJS56992.1 MerR family transcriptional regulator [Streptomyces rubellomurinus subsp. indigoferus]KJS62639.1 MerR family transcriptional regulator [Streptomyces rubellomurinus]
MAQYYSVEQVAELLGLHVRTVRGYIRDGRLAATRIGKQYRIAQVDLEALTGAPVAPARRRAEVSAVVRIEDVDRAEADRLSTAVLAAVAGPRDGGRPLHVEAVHDPQGRTLRLILLGDPADTAALLAIVHTFS